MGQSKYLDIDNLLKFAPVYCCLFTVIRVQSKSANVEQLLKL